MSFTDIRYFCLKYLLSEFYFKEKVIKKFAEFLIEKKSNHILENFFSSWKKSE